MLCPVSPSTDIKLTAIAPVSAAVLKRMYAGYNSPAVVPTKLTSIVIVLFEFLIKLAVPKIPELSKVAISNNLESICVTTSGVSSSLAQIVKSAIEIKRKKYLRVLMD